MDVDILIQSDPRNVSALLALLERFGEGSARELTVEDFKLEEGCIRVVEDFPVDIFTIVGGDTYEDLLPETLPHSIEDVELRYLNIEALIRLKPDSLRPLDQLDVQALRSIQDGEEG